ncbi:TolC family outer membrane protein [Sulfuriflexus mobilis]|uniref:TolC family outer membrane protein n=1 Tax=Sulfuriflexus mobilis TaxID=1811807 RepID=UPI000F849F08|nr:TolC family outer membrane protein [Sulfuriflexus mobilis]
MKTVRLLTLTLSLCAPAAVLAGGLTDAYRQALESDPQLRAAEAARGALGEAGPQSLALLLPSLNLSANTTANDVETTQSSFFPNNSEEYNSNGYNLTLTQPIYHHDYWVGLRQADATVAQAEADYAAARQELIVRVATAYFDVLAAQDTLEFARAEKEATARQLEQAKQRFEVGLIAITDVHEAQAQYDLTVAQEIVAENTLANTREALQEITGQYDEALQVLREEIPLLNPEPYNIDAWVTQARDQNLSLRAAEFSATAAREEINRQRAGHYPTLDLVATQSNSLSHSITGREVDSETLALQLNVPLFAGGAVNSRTREAHYRSEEARHRLEQTRRSVKRQTRDAYLGVLAGISRVKALKQAVLSNEKALEATQTGFEVGTRTIVDVLLSQRELFRAQRDYSRSRYDYLLNTFRLKQAAGSLAQTDVEAINGWLK